MRTNRSITRATFHIAVTLALLLGAGEKWGEMPAEKTAISAASDFCEALALGDPTGILNRRAAGHGLVVVVRILDSRGSLYQITARQASSGDAELTLVEAEKADFTEVLARLGTSGNSSTLAKACQSVKTSKSDLSASNKAKIGDLLSKFKDISITPTVGGPLVLDGPTYRLWVLSAPINLSYFRFQGSGPQSASNNPLQAWIDDLVSLAGLPAPYKAQRSNPG